MTDIYELTNRSAHSVTGKDEPTTDRFNLYNSERRPYKTDQIDLFGGIEDKSTNRSTQS
jgi:hypothetical protein